MAARRCAGCSKFLPKSVGRGRPALSCSKCRAAKEVVILRSCRDCDVPLSTPVGRGRPPVRCDDCRPVKVLINA